MSAELRVGLVQVNNSFSGQNYLPYATACLQGYVEHNSPRPQRYEFLLPLYKRVPIGLAVEHLATADVVGFSTYVWNAQISLEVARRLEHARPEVTVVFGGPQVPDDPEAFLREHRFVDIAVHNEGERSFLALLEGLPDGDWRETPGISFLDADGVLVQNAGGPRIRDLEEVPSPFLTGAFDALMAAHPDEHWIALWETNRGCPFKCTFCDWGSATAAKVNKFDIDRLFREVDWFVDRRIEYVFCCDANFGIQKRDVELSQYAAEAKRRSGYPVALSVQNTKNATERAYLTQKILADAGLNKGVALSMQSLDARTLENIKRDNISLATYFELQRRFARDGVETYSDLILALPGETYDSFADGVDRLIEAGQHNRIQFNNLSILPNAEMGDPRYIEKFGMLTIESEIINIHGSREQLEDDVPELQQLVIATGAMPAKDWRRARAFSWMTAFLHFDKLLQMPLILTRVLTGLSYRQIIEAFLGADERRHPVIADVRDFFLSEARKIQAGGPEYVYSEQWLGIYWPADEYAFIQATADDRLGDLYDEARDLLLGLTPEGGSQSVQALEDAIALNRALVRLPRADGDCVVMLDYDIPGFCRAVREGAEATLRKEPTRVHVDRSSACYPTFDDWCREVVWWGNKKGAYLYDSRPAEPQLAGHF